MPADDRPSLTDMFESVVTPPHPQTRFPFHGTFLFKTGTHLVSNIIIKGQKRSKTLKGLDSGNNYKSLQ